VTDGQAVVPAVVSLEVGENGDVTGFVVQDPGQYFKSTGEIQSVTVTSGGVYQGVNGGYSEGDSLIFTCTDGTTVHPAYAVATFDAGVMTGVQVLDGGRYYKSTGSIESVSVSNGGEYYATSGAVQRVEVYEGGAYYAEEGTGEVDADEPTVTISSSTGQGATATATVGKTIGSPQFGKITGISVANGGSGYRTTGYGWKATVSVGPLMHRAGECLVLSGSGCDEDGNTPSCPDFSQYIVHESERITTDGCPTSLLSRSYKMAYRQTLSLSQAGDSGIDGAEGADYCPSGYVFGGFYNILTIADFGSGDITCTLAPA